MAVACNGKSNGYIRVRWKMISTVTVVGGALITLFTLGGYGYSYVRTATERELRCQKTEERVGAMEEGVGDIKFTLCELGEQFPTMQSSINEINVHLGYIRNQLDQLEKERRRRD